MDLRALGVLLNFLGQFGFQAGDFRRQLRAVEHRRWPGLRSGLGFFAFDRGFLLLRGAGGDGGLGCFLAHCWLLRCGGWSDALDLTVLKQRLLGGLWRCLVFQGAAALLVVLGEEVSLFGLFFAFEGGQGNFQGFTDLAWLGQSKAQAEDQRGMQYGSEEQRKAQAVRRLYAGAGKFRELGCCVHRVSGLLRLPRSLPRVHGKVYEALRALSFSAILSISCSPMRVSKATLISRMQVGLVTLISVRCSPITSRPTNSRPFSAILSISCSPMRVSKATSISRMQVGLVTLISVRCSPITSRPTNSRPFSRD